MCGRSATPGVRRAVVSSSTNWCDVLIAAHIEDLFEQRIDGLTAQREHLAGKPAPDMFLAGAHALGVEPGDAVVFEDALVGGRRRAGGFGYVIGVGCAGQADRSSRTVPTRWSPTWATC